MRTTPTRMDEVLAKRAKVYDAMAARAEIRRVRALKLGNRREAEGAKITIADAHDSARRLRAGIGKKPGPGVTSMGGA